MKYSSKLTKRYYFPIVEGSNYGYFTKDARTYNAFTTYIPGLRSLVKVVNYSQIWHWWGNRPIIFRKGYYVGWYPLGQEMLSKLHKANLYLNRQYCRMEQYLKDEDVERYTKLVDLISKRSKLFRLVLIVRKLPFAEVGVLRVLRLMKSVGKLMKRNEFKVKIKRVFMPEYDELGNIKKHRPLGVPSVEWRIIGAMKEFYLVNMWAGNWSPNQYACIPGRGVADAWIDILEKYSYGVRYILGFDLAKFFDSVYVTTLTWTLWNVPEHTFGWFKNMCLWNGVRVRPQDKKKEEGREAQMMDQLRRSLASNSLSAYAAFKPVKRGFPQGLNTSPLMCCRALQLTGFLDDPTIVQYMDDGIIMREGKIHISMLNGLLKSPHSGIAISPEKTEWIMWDGKWKKPLKFLGCSFDGVTFKAHTREGGVYEVRDAQERITEILQWLRDNRSKLGPYRQKMTKLIADGWNREDVKTTWWSLAKGGRPNFELTTMQDTWWEGTKARITRLPYNSVEAMAYARYSRLTGPLWESSNTSTMICSYYLLAIQSEISQARKTAYANRVRVEAYGKVEQRNRLLDDW
jgi:hypothetical protein